MSKRWTIDKMKEYRKFCGWDFLERLIDHIDYDLRGPSKETLVHDEEEQKELRALTAITFETGARIGEAIGSDEHHHIPGMAKEDFDLSRKEYVTAIFEIEKSYKKVENATKFKATDETKLRWSSEEEAKRSGHPYEAYEGFTTERDMAVRHVAIPKSEPLVGIMVDWIQESNEGKLFDVKYNKYYRTITSAGKKLGTEFPPHRLRAERATQLATEYKLSDHKLTEWFAWRDPRMARDYTSLAEVTAEEMLEGAKEMFGKARAGRGN